MIEIHHFTKHYGEFRAVEDLSLSIPAGEIFGFIGPNGAGKSTTIRFLATLLRATSGDGTVNGFSVSKKPMDVRRSIGYMPDSFGVYDGMRVWEFLDFFATAYDLPRKRRREVIAAVLDMVDLGHKRNDFVNGLSRGMKQRLCLAKTLVHEPPVLILDEPTSGLDPRARMEVKALLKELRNMGKTILISSHILAELADSCTSIGIIERGQLLMHGPIETVYQQIRGNRRLSIKIVGEMPDVERAMSLIRSLPQTIQCHADGTRITVEIDTDDAGVASLLQSLLKSDLIVASFSEREPTLEDVFMSVTKGLVS
jgi:ABC-2 type transport system ATP-binding protein